MDALLAGALFAEIYADDFFGPRVLGDVDGGRCLLAQVAFHIFLACFTASAPQRSSNSDGPQTDPDLT